MTFAPFRLGPYECVSELRTGSTANLYVAWLQGVEGFQKTVVVKRVHDHVAQDPEFVRRLVHEARLGAALGHANIVRVLECGTDEVSGAYYVASELVDGVSLQQLLTSLDRRGRRLPPEAAVALTMGIADALDYAHCFRLHPGAAAGVPHGALRPSKVLVPREGGVRLLDFGVAGALSYARRSAPDTHWADSAYLAPEVITRGEVTPAGDLFSLGAMLYELITADALFLRGNAAATLQAVQAARVPAHPALEPELADLVQGLVAPDPATRGPAGDDLHDQLAQWLAARRLTPAMAWAQAHTPLDEVFADWPSVRPAAPLPQAADAPHAPSVPYGIDGIESTRHRPTVELHGVDQSGDRSGGRGAAGLDSGFLDEEITNELHPMGADPWDPLSALDDALADLEAPIGPVPIAGALAPPTRPTAWEPPVIDDNEQDIRYTVVRRGEAPASPTPSERVVDVIAALEQHLSESPRDVEARIHLGSLYRMQDRLPEAEALLLAVLAEVPGHAEAWYHLGLVHERQHRFTDAKQAWQQAVTLDPGYVHARLAHANLLLREGQVAEAVDRLTDILVTHWQSGRAHLLLTICYFQLEDYQAAHQHLDYAEQYGEDVSQLRQRLSEQGG
jgi:serine/threonine-protein kinase